MVGLVVYLIVRRVVGRGGSVGDKGKLGVEKLVKRRAPLPPEVDVDADVDTCSSCTKVSTFPSNSLTRNEPHL